VKDYTDEVWMEYYGDASLMMKYHPYLRHVMEVHVEGIFQGG